MVVVEEINQTDPAINLALEEYLMRNVVVDEPLLLFYVNDPAVIVGRNQNVFEELDPDFAAQQDIAVIRRLSGGGTVYHDHGNLNYSLIAPEQGLLNRYTDFTKPVVDALQMLGLKAELRNRSSLFVNGKKVSGNAQYASGGKLVSHGTLLVNADLERLRGSIHPRTYQVASKAIQSIRSSVANLQEFLPGVALEKMRELVRDGFLAGTRPITLALDDAAWTASAEIAAERYRSWDWNVGRSPRSTLTKRTSTPAGPAEFAITVEHGRIQAIEVISIPDALEQQATLLQHLAGVRFHPGDMKRTLAQTGNLRLLSGFEPLDPVSLLY